MSSQARLVDETFVMFSYDVIPVAQNMSYDTLLPLELGYLAPLVRKVNPSHTARSGNLFPPHVSQVFSLSDLSMILESCSRVVSSTFEREALQIMH